MSDGVLVALISSGFLAASTVIGAALARMSHRDGGLETRNLRLERENRLLNDHVHAHRRYEAAHGLDPLPWPEQLTE